MLLYVWLYLYTFIYKVNLKQGVIRYQTIIIFFLEFKFFGDYNIFKSVSRVVKQ